MTFEINLRRSLGRKIAKKKLDKHVHHFLRLACANNRGKGWEHTVRSGLSVHGGVWLYVARIHFEKTEGQKAAAEGQWQKIAARLVKAARSTRYAQHPWQIDGTRLNVPSAPEPAPPERVEKVKDYAQVSLDLGHHFDHIYGREPHILRVYTALETAVQTQLQSRHHCVLYGPPGCGKTEILLSFGKMLGVENEAYMKFDATSMTQAGVLKLLMESRYIPPVLIVEEIEKTADADLRWLLGILDKRGEVRQTNFRVGNRMRNVKMLCLATVNDISLFRRVMSGALASRFAHQVYCERPDRALMQRILDREVAAIGGDRRWIEPTLAFCVDDLGWNDPRQIIPVCLCGKDRLLDGSYQKAIRATVPPEGSK